MILQIDCATSRSTRVIRWREERANAWYRTRSFFENWHATVIDRIVQDGHAIAIDVQRWCTESFNGRYRRAGAVR